MAIKQNYNTNKPTEGKHFVEVEGGGEIPLWAGFAKLRSTDTVGGSTFTLADGQEGQTIQLFGNSDGVASIDDIRINCTLARLDGVAGSRYQYKESSGVWAPWENTNGLNLADWTLVTAIWMDGKWHFSAGANYTP